VEINTAGGDDLDGLARLAGVSRRAGESPFVPDYKIPDTKQGRAQLARQVRLFLDGRCGEELDWLAVEYALARPRGDAGLGSPRVNDADFRDMIAKVALDMKNKLDSVDKISAFAEIVYYAPEWQTRWMFAIMERALAGHVDEPNIPMVCEYRARERARMSRDLLGVHVVPLDSSTVVRAEPGSRQYLGVVVAVEGKLVTVRTPDSTVLMRWSWERAPRAGATWGESPIAPITPTLRALQVAREAATLEGREFFTLRGVGKFGDTYTYQIRDSQSLTDSIGMLREMPPDAMTVQFWSKIDPSKWGSVRGVSIEGTIDDDGEHRAKVLTEARYCSGVTLDDMRAVARDVDGVRAVLEVVRIEDGHVGVRVDVGEIDDRKAADLLTAVELAVGNAAAAGVVVIVRDQKGRRAGRRSRYEESNVSAARIAVDLRERERRLATQLRVQTDEDADTDNFGDAP
jgi:hypothetical protein